MNKKSEFNLQNIPIRTEEGARIRQMFMNTWPGVHELQNAMKLCPSRRLKDPSYACEGYAGHEGDHHACNRREVWAEQDGENVL